ncbi:hypothetical protein GW17_00017911 [Ensete ventricosum]|nr:hypothetical protein GW17_00017911 [Ensete ventricosum]
MEVKPDPYLCPRYGDQDCLCPETRGWEARSPSSPKAWRSRSPPLETWEVGKPDPHLCQKTKRSKNPTSSDQCASLDNMRGSTSSTNHHSTRNRHVVSWVEGEDESHPPLVCSRGQGSKRGNYWLTPSCHPRGQEAKGKRLKITSP